MKLVIVESPAKCKKIQGYLGEGWEVHASIGHIRDLPQKELGVDLDTFRPTYVETKPDVIRKLKARAKLATQVWLATDLDREGEAIAWHLQRVLGAKDAKRIVFNEITQEAVRNAVASPRTVDIHRVAAQEARRVADRLVGYIVSPVLCNRANDRLSAGRVQSVVVKLVVERDQAINDFRVTNHFTVALNFRGEQPWVATLDTAAYVSDENPYITDKAFVETIAKLSAVKVVGNETKPRFQKAPGAFMTDTLQQAASVQLKMPTDQTMKAAQTLYELGFITYHRTDFPNLSDEGRELTYNRLREIGYADAIPDQPNLEKVQDGSQEAHEAIRPANYSQSTDSLDTACQSLYQLIVERTLASQMKAAHYNQQIIVLEALGADVDGVAPVFKATGNALVYAGWKSLTPDDQTNEDAESQDATLTVLPNVDYGAVLIDFAAQIKDKKTKPPAKFTEASIIKFLKKMQIGRPATYASIMKNITDRSYIVFDKRKISATDKGRLVVQMLNDFTFMEYGFTQELEKDLDKVAIGDMSYAEVVKKLHETLMGNMSLLDNVIVKVSNPCPKCGSQVNRVKGKFGFFWSCSGFREGCDFTGQDSKGKMLTEEQAIARREKKAKQTEATEHLCNCGEGSLVRRQAKKKGANGEAQYWYGCNTFPVCKLTFFEVDGKPKMEIKGGLSTDKGSQQT